MQTCFHIKGLHNCHGKGFLVFTISYDKSKELENNNIAMGSKDVIEL